MAKLGILWAIKKYFLKIRMRAKFLVLVALLLSVLLEVNGLYEDQAGQIDWKKSLIGPPTVASAGFRSNRRTFPVSFTFSSETATLAALNSDSGDVLWRKVFGSIDNDFKAISVLPVSSSKQVTKTSPTFDEFVIDLVSFHISSGFLHISAWDSLDGTLMWENDVELADESTTIFLGATIVKAGNKNIVIAGFEDKIVALDVATGRLSVLLNSKKVSDIALSSDKTSLLVLEGETVSEVKFASMEHKKIGTVSVSEAKAISYLRFISIDGTENISIVGSSSSGELLVFNPFDLKESPKSLKNPISAKITSFKTIKTENSLVATSILFVEGEAVLQIKPTKIDVVLKLNSKDAPFFFFWRKKNAVVSITGSNLFLNQQKISFPNNIDFKDRGDFTDVSFSQRGELYITFADATFMKFSLADDSIKHSFTREEALASLVGKPLMVEMPMILDQTKSKGTGNLQGLEVEAQLLKRISKFHENWKDSDLTSKLNLSLLLERLHSQYRMVLRNVVGVFLHLANVASDIITSQGGYFLDMYKGNLEGKAYSLEEKHNFGFVNVIIVLSSKGKLFGLNSDSGSVLFSKSIDAFNENNFVDLILVRGNPLGVHSATFAVVMKTEVAFFNCFTGDKQSSKSFKGREVFRAIKLDEELLILFEDSLGAELVSDYDHPLDSETLLQRINLFSYLKPSVSETMVIGFKLVASSLNNIQTAETFGLSVPKDHKILSLALHEEDPVNTVGRHIGGGSVMIKHLNPSIAAVFSFNVDDPSEVLVQVIDASSGSVLTKFQEDSCLAGSVNSIVFENNLLYSCFSPSNSRTELNSISIFWDIVLEKFDLNLFKQPNQLNKIINDKSDVIIEQKSFFLPKRINSLAITKTMRGITEKKLVMVLDNGQIAVIDRRLIDPRRPVGAKGKLTKEEKEEGVIPYSPLVPVTSQFVVSYYSALAEMTAAETFPTKLESTCLLFASGLDLFFTRLQPSSGFDLLPEEFNYPLLICMVISLFSAVVFLMNAMSTKRLRDQWK